MQLRIATAACACVLLLCADRGIDGQEQSAALPTIQRYDRPVAGALSPRNANYTIDVRLDHANRTLHGRETINWRNISSAPTSELQFHLYWNAWRDRNSTWLRERRLAGNVTPPRDDAWGSIEVTAVRHVGLQNAPAQDLTSSVRYSSPDDGNPDDRTVITFPVPTIEPQADITVEIEWTARIPRPFARTGYIDDYYFVAHWFPKVGVLEDTGWNTHQFHGATEFYADYGTYDVSITVPAEFIVGATGVSDQRTDNADGTTTHRFSAADVADFAWTASPHFIEATRPFEHATLPDVTMRLLLQPEHAGQEDRHFAATAAALKYYGEWFGPYPYSVVTIVDPAYQSGSGGMEYPMLFTAGSRWLAPRDVTVPESVTIHEAGHQFWYAIVGSNEFEHAWLDEGLNTFSTARVIEAIGHPNRLGARYFGGFIPWVIGDVRLTRATDGNRLNTYRLAAEADVQATPTYLYWPGTATAMSYDKTALWLHTLERHLGWPVLQKILATYFDRWKFRHPKPEDFFRVVNEVSGEDLTWFFDQVHRSSNVFDYGVQELTTEEVDRPDTDGPDGAAAYRTIVVARRFGEATFPVDVVTTFANGEQVKERWDGRDRRAMYVYERSARARSVQVDPQRVLLLDVNYTNNTRTLAPRAGEASLKWSLKWMVWLQELMLTYAFFV